MGAGRLKRTATGRIHAFYVVSFTHTRYTDVLRPPSVTDSQGLGGGGGRSSLSEPDGTYGTMAGQVKSKRKIKSDRNNSNGLGLCLLALTISSYGYGALGVTECSRVAPYFLTADQRTTLCRQVHTSAPADCARRARTAPGLTGLLIVELCSGAVSDLPGVCVASMSRSIAAYLSPELRIEVCMGARSDAPAKCVEHSKNYKQQPQLVVDVCTGASSVAPARCLDLLPRAVSYEAAASLCRRVQTEGPAHCTNARGQLSQGLELTARLCQGADSQGPADCFRRSTLGFELSTDDRVELCSGAQTDAPARCAGNIRDRRLEPSERVALCRGASSTAPAVCLASLPPSLPSQSRVALCQGAEESNPTAAALCFKAVPQNLPLTIATALCRGASDSMGAECAKVARHTVGDTDDIAKLCRGASSRAPAHCAKKALRAGVEKHLAAILCSGSTSLAPALCFLAAPAQIPAEVRVTACAGTQSTSPGHCMIAAMPRGLQAPASEAVCPLDQEAGSFPRRRLEYRLAGRLCRDASDNSPAECARSVPSGLSDGEVELLCAAKNIPQGEATAKCAAAALAFGFSSRNAASLCRGAGSDAPAACAAMIAPRIGEDGRLAVCTGASSNAPARCANSVSVARALSAVDVSECKSAIPQPSGLHITNLGHEGDVLFVDQPMRATLEVRDQWGGSISSDSSTVVRASVALRGSGGASVNAVGRFNTSSEGLVHFSQLSFSGAGSLTLQFSIDGGDGGNTPLAAALVIVAETEHGVVARRCGRIFRQLACPPEADAERADEGMVKHHEPIRTEAVSIVSGGTAAAWQVLTCQRTLEENGVHVAYFPWGTSSLNAWLWYHPGIEALETGAGLPSRNQPAWETLGVERGAHARELRRAYYRQSLLWHPDRWVRHAMHSARAEEVFEIVSEAYAWMVNERSNGRRD